MLRYCVKYNDYQWSQHLSFLTVIFIYLSIVSLIKSLLNKAYKKGSFTINVKNNSSANYSYIVRIQNITLYVRVAYETLNLVYNRSKIYNGNRTTFTLIISMWRLNAL